MIFGKIFDIFERKLKFPKSIKVKVDVKTKKLHKIHNRTKEDYIKLDVTCNIIEAPSPSFLWNIDEKEIQTPLQIWAVNKIKSGNRIVLCKTYSDLTQTDIDSINDNYGIAILLVTESVEKDKRKLYRFGILENGLEEIRDKKIEEIIKEEKTDNKKLINTDYANDN